MNALLAALPPEDRQRLAPHLQSRPLKLRETLHKNGDPIRDVFFPGRCMVSITHSMEDGGMLEVAVVGPEGLVGVGAILGDRIATGEAFIQVEGEPAQAMPIGIFNAEMARRGAFHDVVSRYSQAFVTMIMQSVACNGLHSAEQRCCRWLLMTHDRVAIDEFPLTHEFLAMMLGVRRPTVTLVLSDLHRKGILSYARGRMRIVDRRRLEDSACECYRQSKAIFRRLLPAVSTGISFANSEGRSGDLSLPHMDHMERMSDVSRKPE
jgi:CRP-like cAMP-binding protein